MMKSAPTLTSHSRFHWFTTLHSGSSVRHTDCDTTGVFDVLDFNVSVAESNQLVPAALHGRNHLADENLLRKALIIVQGAVNAAVKILLDFQQAGFLKRVCLIRPTAQ